VDTLPNTIAVALTLLRSVMKNLSQTYIGGISKTDLKRFLLWAKVNFDLPILDKFLHATPTAELEPITEDYVQSDEVLRSLSKLTCRWTWE